MKRQPEPDLNEWLGELSRYGCLDVAAHQLFSSGLVIRQEGPPHASRLIDIWGIKFAVILNLALTDRLSHSVLLLPSPELKLLGEDSWVRWLDDPIEVCDSYLIPCTPLEFPRSDVINHEMEKGMRIGRGNTKRGFLLGLVEKPLPQHLRHGELVRAELLFEAYGDMAFRSDVELVVDRKTGRRRQPRKGVHRESLFAESECTSASSG
jgi:hypothetical protein